MKYFRHFSNASTSLKLQCIMERHGLEGYGRYWLFLELLNDKFDGSSTVIEIHFKELLKRLEFRLKSGLKKFNDTLTELKIISIISENDSVLVVDCPILLELMDRDSKYNRKERVRSAEKATLEEEEDIDKEEDKGKENKENVQAEIIAPEPQKINATKNDLDWFMQLFNDNATSHGMSRIKTLSDARKKAIRKALKAIGDDLEIWRKVFNVAGSKGFLKANGEFWMPEFDYIFRNENYIKFSEADQFKKIIKPSAMDRNLELLRANPYRSES